MQYLQLAAFHRYVIVPHDLLCRACVRGQQQFSYREFCESLKSQSNFQKKKNITNLSAYKI